MTEEIRHTKKDFYPGWEEMTRTPKDAERSFKKMTLILDKIGVEVTNQTRILEIGSGLGYFTKHLAENGYDVMAVDANPRGNNDIPVAKLHAEMLPFDEVDPKQRFDLVIGFAIFDPTVYRQNISKMLSEIGRVLEVGGVGYFRSLHVSRDELKEALPDSLEVVLEDSFTFVVKKK